MAMQVMFAPGYVPPWRIKMESQMLKAQALEKSVETVSDAVNSYLDRKTKQKYEKLGTMNALLGTYGSESLGAPFQHEYGTLLHTMGIEMPKDEAGLYKLEPSFEDNLRKHIIAHPEMIPALMGTVRPDMSPSEIHWKSQEEDIKWAQIQAKQDASEALAASRHETEMERLHGIELQQAGATERTKIGAETKKDVAKLTVEGRPYASPSGYMNWKGTLIPQAKYDKNPTKFADAYPLNAGQYHLQLGDAKTRQMTHDQATKAGLVETKLQQDLENDQLKPFVMSIGAAIKSGNKDLANQITSQLVSRLNETEGWQLTQEDLTSPAFVRAMNRIVTRVFGNAVPAQAQKDKKDRDANQGKGPQRKPARQITLPSGAVGYEEEVP